MTWSPRALSLPRLLAVAWLSLAVAAPVMADEIAADPTDAAFHLDDASLPDPGRTPGGTSPDVTTEDLCTTPAEEFAGEPPATLCDEAFAEQRIPPDYRFQYRCGFLVPPTIGGSDARKNVWLQPANEAVLKQAADKEARKQVCQHGIALAEAQSLMSRDWVGLYRKFFRPHDKLLSIAKTEGAPSAFDGLPPPPAPLGAPPSACLGNGGAGGASAYGGAAVGNGYAGDLGGGGLDERRRRRDGGRNPKGRSAPGSRPLINSPVSERSRSFRNGPGGVSSSERNRRVGAFEQGPDAAMAPRDRLPPRGLSDGRSPHPGDGPSRPLGAEARLAQSATPRNLAPQSTVPPIPPRIGIRGPQSGGAPRRPGRSGVQRRHR